MYVDALVTIAEALTLLFVSASPIAKYNVQTRSRMVVKHIGNKCIAPKHKYKYQVPHLWS